MKKTIMALFCLSLIATISNVQAASASFANGDFGSGLNNWDAYGAAVLNAGQVELSTAGGLFPAASLIQGDFFVGDSIQLGATDNYLNFDVSYMDLGSGGGTGSPFSDNLGVSVLDEFGTGLTDLIFVSGADFSVGASLVTVSLDVSSLAGLSIGLFFDVFDEDDGRDSKFTLDNISFTETILQNVSPVPVPGALLLMSTGMMFLASFSQFKQKYLKG